MNTQVITIDATGGLHGLQVKPDKGINLQGFGKAHTRRISEVEWDYDLQKWAVRVLLGRWAGISLNEAMYAIATTSPMYPPLKSDEQVTGEAADKFLDSLSEAALSKAPLLVTGSYDESVAHEVNFFNQVRLQVGQKFLA